MEWIIRLRIASSMVSRGGGNRTPVTGFGDQHHTTRPHPRMAYSNFVLSPSQSPFISFLFPYVGDAVGTSYRIFSVLAYGYPVA